MSLSRDYLIAGAGSAGCAVASRLAEDPDVTAGETVASPPRTG